ncbi:antitoxin [Arthrobacter cheniae]|uniref:Antitoxin n=1 Tax=Arthrobacter cheniae TaxID=1258888 RepID=A0A3A5M4N0_9MICC|nr:antitoxin [Arthrobacter cheniae]RJT77958.1 antitoxin [Arthrobacter cheniae]
MGLFSGRSRGALAAKAISLIRNNPGKVMNGIVKAGDFANKRTHGKYSHQITGVQSKAAKAIDSVARKNGPGGTSSIDPTYRPK